MISCSSRKKSKKISINKKTSYICRPKTGGTIAQMVEQRTENPCVTGSIPVGTTEKQKAHFLMEMGFFLCLKLVLKQ